MCVYYVCMYVLKQVLKYIYDIFLVMINNIIIVCISIAGIHHDNASVLILYIVFLFDRSLLFVYNGDLVSFLLYTLV